MEMASTAILGTKSVLMPDVASSRRNLKEWDKI